MSDNPIRRSALAGRATETDATTAVKAPDSIVFNRVSVTYGRGKKSTDALRDFTLRARRGETIALLGPSGSGKSTALKALAGFVRPSAGQVFLNGDDITDLPPAKRGIGVVVQSYALFPHMRVADNVAFGLKARRLPRKVIAERVEESLSMVAMGEYASRLPRELSGGQQQRVAIARALAIRPEVLLLDEPLAALDAALRSSMVVELQHLRDALPDTTMLYVTHDQTEALALADRIGVMRDASLVDLGTADELWSRPPTDFTAGFLGGANLIPCTVGRVSGSTALVEAGGKMFSTNAPEPVQRWAPGSPALICVRPHDVEVAPAGAHGSMWARVDGSVWRGSTTRVSLAVEGLPDQLIDADVVGHVDYAPGSVVGVRFPDPIGVLVASEGTPR
ncbi:MAG TPA: ABC transporter ATP-binding protein [Gordonia polyisoprenivorans]|uniref:ABC-type quaternary amine transporter n=1 Tax=Gordonia polyisoprenivorans TaxID=84595 RepID=A0A846WR11_9ACTN|nr:ABC transporter ATP-binding protein [Gordonia polyisoprenivorans]MBE7194847.1 ABC transporter ATP-binding protein [Gordonia polyisoprenivorans]NKY03210.1 ABC transporter ATP-binding protein [Gordonia polyisoprenivorans]OZC31865.1 ABC transporter ATP-binding protein [Gordonia polyisoprenivorans]UZF55232.1 ABC transporter ATP-binding protein [Gordonia polyisoprenivorans]WCB36405.1 ABC transporter ATP-binding protein [Gordonia polyisoprenivorans]